MYFDFANVLVYSTVAVLFILVALTAGKLIRRHHPDAQKLSTYECGEDPVGTAWVQFNVRFYIIALIFLIFDVEIAVLFPWTTIFKEKGLGLYALVEMFVFLGILGVGFAYVWAKGDLEWLKSVTEVRTDKRESN